MRKQSAAGCVTNLLSIKKRMVLKMIAFIFAAING
jgi:hypothetical protein